MTSNDSSAPSAKELAIVVGASGAFGQEIVKQLLAQGLAILAVGRILESLQALAETNPNIALCQADISDDSSIEAIKAAITMPVRMVVHGPGVGVAGGIMVAPTETMVDAVNIKVGGMLRLTRAADAHLTANARLVAIAGHYGLEPTEYAASAGVANAALFNVMRQLSIAYGKRGISVHTIAPGPADTERLRRVAAARAEQRGISVDEVLDEMLEESSTRTFTTADQVAWTVCNLLDDRAIAMTGSTIMLDSGRRKGLP